MFSLSALLLSTIALTTIDSLYDHDMKQYDSLFQQSTSAIVGNTLNKKGTLYKHDSSSTHIGIKIGLGWSNFYGKDAEQMDQEARSIGVNPGSRFGVLFGGSFSYDISRFFTFGIDADYAMKGKKLTSTVFNVKQTQIFKFNYLELPVMFKVNIPNDGAFKPNLFFGPSVSLLVSAEDYFRLEYNGSSRDTSVSLTGVVNSTEYGVVFGIGGYEITDEGNISLEARCSLGLSSTDNSKPVSAIIKNWQIAIILGFLFPI
jgi:hypothetical protein